jgi:hypothetical protein
VRKWLIGVWRRGVANLDLLGARCREQVAIHLAAREKALGPLRSDGRLLLHERCTTPRADTRGCSLQSARDVMMRTALAACFCEPGWVSAAQER